MLAIASPSTHYELSPRAPYGVRRPLPESRDSAHLVPERYGWSAIH